MTDITKIPVNPVSVLNFLLKHYYSLFSSDEIHEVFNDSGIYLDQDTGLIGGAGPAVTDIWNFFFELIVSRKGYRWLALIEKDMTKIVNKYNVEYPSIFHSYVYELENKCTQLEREKDALIENLRTAKLEYDNRMYKDPLAQVYKEDIFRENLITDISAFRELGIDFSFFIIEIDNLVALNIKYGRDAGDEMLANTAYVLKNFKKSNRDYAHHLIFRMNGPRFTYYCTDTVKDDMISIAENIRTEFRESKLFITGITVSEGLVHSAEFSGNDRDPADLSHNIIEVANSRLRLARHKGGDLVCSESETAGSFDSENYVLVVDPDINICYMLEKHLSEAGFNVAICRMGDEALEKIDLKKPAVIVSGLMLPKIDGFTLRKKLLEDSSHKDIPFILTSMIKDEKSIIRAQSMGIYHFYKKPYSIVELIGLVRKLSKAEA